VTSSGPANRYRFRTLISCMNRKKLGDDKCMEYSGCSRAVTLCLAQYFLTTNDQCAGVSCGRNQLFCAQFSGCFRLELIFLCPLISHEYSFISHFTQYYVYWMFLSFVEVGCRPQRGLLLTLARMPIVNLHFIHCHFTICFFKDL
jgi:hypothetical protein